MEPWPAGVGREIHAALDSTNAEALRRAATGAAGPVWILAQTQTAGRARRGRAWHMPPGNFAASLLMRPEGPPAAAALRSFAAALALDDALVAAGVPCERLTLKWPNDVLLDGRKLAGILLETGGPVGGPLALAVGIGVNLVAAPDAGDLEPGAADPVALGPATGITLSPEALLDRIAPAFARWAARLQFGGFDALREPWLARAARLGEPIVARLPGRALSGRFETVDATGALVLVTDTGRVSLPAAEIHFAGEAGDAARH
jgi:BirA family transcriptional regulator, biotin operon repressor / biotin---[acetyl-CoA-carboxylase] ligase